MITNNDSIQYAGFVNIKEYRGNKLLRTYELHNAGTNWLFKVLALALVGSDQRLNMPKFFDMGIKEGDYFSSGLTARIGLTAEVIERFTTDSTLFGYSAKFTATIPAASLTKSSASCYRLASKGDDAETNVLAEIQLDNAISYKKSLGYSYIVEWVMTFTNVQAEVENDSSAS